MEVFFGFVGDSIECVVVFMFIRFLMLFVGNGENVNGVGDEVGDIGE